jgi:putative transcriptional regulator
MKSEIDYFKIETNKATPEKGKVLIAEPFLSEVYFKRSLLLLVECNEEGAIGFVMNKPVALKIQEIIDGFPEFDADISIGGPVQTNTIHFIHTLGNIITGATPIGGNLYWGGQFDVLQDLIAKKLVNRNQVKFFMGYSGWSTSQLEEEIAQNSWLVCNLKENEIMKPQTTNSWETTLLSLGSRYRLWTNAPSNPSLN